MRYIDLAWYHLTEIHYYYLLLSSSSHHHQQTLPFKLSGKQNQYESPTHRPPVSNPSQLRHPQCRSLYKRWNQRRSDSSWCESERRGSREGLRLRWLEEDLPPTSWHSSPFTFSITNQSIWLTVIVRSSSKKMRQTKGGMLLLESQPKK